MKRPLIISLAVIAVVSFLYLTYRFGFLRKPERNTIASDLLFYSPANGTIISIRPYNVATDGPYLVETKDSPAEDRGAIPLILNDVADSGTVVTISLAFDDVHYQRAPTAGMVGLTRYTAGKHEAIVLNAEAEPRYQNEHNEILLTDNRGNNYKVVQIAGFVARSIKCKVQAGQQIKQGQIIGSIEIGSQVTIILPPGYEVIASEGDYVTDGETVLAKINN